MGLSPLAPAEASARVGVSRMRVSSETSDHQRLIRSLELKLELLEYGLGMPRDEDAIARTKALLKEAEGVLRSGHALRRIAV